MDVCVFAQRKREIPVVLFSNYDNSVYWHSMGKKVLQIENWFSIKYDITVDSSWILTPSTRFTKINNFSTNAINVQFGESMHGLIKKKLALHAVLFYTLIDDFFFTNFFFSKKFSGFFLGKII